MAANSRQRQDPEAAAKCRLVERIVASDQAAIADLYDATRGQIFGLAKRILDNHEAAEDVVIEVFAQCWRQASTFDSAKGNVMAWLLNLTRSRAIDSLRANRRHSIGEPLDHHQDAVRSNAPGPADTSIDAQRRRIVRSALDHLPEPQRRAIELAFYSGLSHARIAERLGQPLGTIKTRIRDGMLKLRRALDPLAEPTARRHA